MLRPRLKTSLAVALFACTISLWPQAVPPEKADDARIDQLLGQMTLEEKSPRENPKPFPSSSLHAPSNIGL